MKRTFLTISGIILLCITAFSQDRTAMEEFRYHEYQNFKDFIALSADHIPDTSIDVGFYYLDLYIAIDSQYIEGAVSCHFEVLTEGVDQIWLSLNKALSVDQVGGSASSFVQTGDSILIVLDDTYGPGDQAMVIMNYHGIPALAGGYKGLRYETHHGNEPIIATLSTPYLAHYWYPCKDGPSDKPDSVYVDITIPVKIVNGVEVMAVSNGVLENIIDNTSTKTYQWRHRYPVVTYYVMVAISNYVHFGEEYTGIYGEEYPLDYYVFQQELPSAMAGVVDMPQALDIFSEKFGVYPFSEEKYGMTQLGFYGAIENQTNTITNNMSSSWFYISVHELGHMWFGDMITCQTWNHAWLNEGFASYSEAIYHEEVNGFDAYQSYMSGFEYWFGGTLYLQNANDTFSIFQSIIYDKGAYVLHMLRGVLGNTVFFDCVKAYASHPDLMYGQASTEDLQLVCEEVSGEDLGFFFDQWIYDEYYPEYHFNFENNVNELDFVIKQVQGEQGRRTLFEMPVEVRLIYENGGDTIVRVWNDQEYQLFNVSVTDVVSMIEIDPDKWILGKAYYHPELPVGLGDKSDSRRSLKVYPNPMGATATIEISDYPENVDFTLYDIYGKEVLRIANPGNGKHTFHKGMLSSGLYIYKMTDSSGRTIDLARLVIL